MALDDLATDPESETRAAYAFRCVEGLIDAVQCFRTHTHAVICDCEQDAHLPPLTRSFVSRLPTDSCPPCSCMA